MSWRTVFLLEYVSPCPKFQESIIERYCHAWQFGPLFIQPLIYYMSYKHGYSLASVLNAVGINALGKAAPYTPSALQK